MSGTVVLYARRGNGTASTPTRSRSCSILTVTPTEVCRPDDWHPMTGVDITAEDAMSWAALDGYEQNAVMVQRRMYLEEVAALRVALRVGP